MRAAYVVVAIVAYFSVLSESTANSAVSHSKITKNSEYLEWNNCMIQPILPNKRRHLVT